MLAVDNVEVILGQNKIVHSSTFALSPGELGCLLGPSGCGKTTLLRALAGFCEIASGNIIINNQTVSSVEQHTPVQNRNIGYVMQDFALFPHLTVAQNIAFGLHRHDPNASDLRVNEMLELVQLTDFRDAYPNALSGGQQQRVAIARALAPAPSLLLLDEPFSALDPALRESLVNEIKAILKASKVTSLMVTHDQGEAFAFADKVAVMNQGTIEQWDGAFALYHCPSTRFVADFIGEGCFIEGKNLGSHIETDLGKFAKQKKTTIESNSDSLGVELLLRPDDLVYAKNGAFWGIIQSKKFRGSHIMYELVLEQSGQHLLCLTPSHNDFAIGSTFCFDVDIAHTVYFPS